MQHWCVCDSGQAGSQLQLGLAPSSTYGQRQAAAQYRQKAQRLTSTQRAPRHVGLCWQAQKCGRVHVARRAAAPFTAAAPGDRVPPAAATEQSSAGPSAEAGSQRAVVLTGASSGIGRATALFLAQQVLYCVHVRRHRSPPCLHCATHALQHPVRMLWAMRRSPVRGRQDAMKPDSGPCPGLAGVCWGAQRWRRSGCRRGTPQHHAAHAGRDR